ncbi:hypothetical protein E2562_031359 [Oryza meyeriana var. granulata]|uniref:Uncharacterized protein n=1 Tax=Oryza meyeriana var. granulata TaxID=110450 RepID=A0A6G1DBJ3_9ORYZ|nr:hypothetical protein E2562_031359 [Oryza meyeriana var. granulata]
MKPPAASPGRAAKQLPAPPGLARLLLSKSQRGGHSRRALATSPMFVSRGRGARVVGDHHAAQERAPPHNRSSPLTSRFPITAPSPTKDAPAAEIATTSRASPSPHKAQKATAMEAQHKERQEEMIIDAVVAARRDDSGSGSGGVPAGFGPVGFGGGGGFSSESGSDRVRGGYPRVLDPSGSGAGADFHPNRGRVLIMGIEGLS